ncbi:MAG: hypothetical protein KYX69_03950 [Sphingomonas sp.]|uniref:hypothetical protein n=1 Tax=Sphingomonas sp. TaxID=28214 RepID=UPI00260603AA|nr:hypothetical protein [Sphingomonas sp.]MDK2766854.1 hypothetical protein [Sphingomonas sp.]
MTGSEGQGFALFTFIGGRIVGSDPMGVLFDGRYDEDGEGTISGSITVTVPANGTVIQGVSTGSSEMTYATPITLAKADLEAAFFPVETPLGAVNVRLQKLRNLN